MQWLREHMAEAAALAAVILPTLIQISPIKVNPWSALARAVGKSINGDMIRSVSDMQKALDKHISIDDERFIKQCRLRILRFNDEILQKKQHTKEHFDEILDDITEYKRYCETHPGYVNSKATMAIGTVEAVYQNCLAENSFL